MALSHPGVCRQIEMLESAGAERLGIEDRGKLEAALAMIRVQADANVGINICGPSRLIQHLLASKAVSTWNMQKLFAAEPWGHRVYFRSPDTQHSPYQGPVMNFADFGLVPVLDYEIVYNEMAYGRVPFSVGRINILKHAAQVPTDRQCESLRTIPSLQESYGDRIPVKVVRNGDPNGIALSGVFDIQSTKGGNQVWMYQYVPYSHASFSVSCDVLQFHDQFEGEQMLRSAVKETGTKTIKVRLNLNPKERLGSNTGYQLQMEPLAFGRASSQSSKVCTFDTANYGAGVYAADFQGGNSMADIYGHSMQFHIEMSSLPTSVQRINFYLPDIGRPFEETVKDQLDSLPLHSEPLQELDSVGTGNA